MDGPAWQYLPRPLIARLKAAKVQQLYEVRLRTGSRLQLTGPCGSVFYGEPLSGREVTEIASAMMDHSLYAWEDQLAQGFFTMQHGFRVGVAGRYKSIDGTVCLTDVRSLCIRIAQECPGCADGVIEYIEKTSCIVLSPPGCGKTTLLRETARMLSQRGQNVAILDERSEIAAMWQGKSGMDVGERTDVIEGLDKPKGIPLILRSLSPQVLVTDELGGDADAAAVQDAMRCGVRVMASAHATSLHDAMRRRSLQPLLADGFEAVVELSAPPGRIAAIYLRKNSDWVSV